MPQNKIISNPKCSPIRCVRYIRNPESVMNNEGAKNWQSDLHSYHYHPLMHLNTMVTIGSRVNQRLLDETADGSAKDTWLKTKKSGKRR